jgi:hypothetical protein
MRDESESASSSSAIVDFNSTANYASFSGSAVGCYIHNSVLMRFFRLHSNAPANTLLLNFAANDMNFLSCVELFANIAGTSGSDFPGLIYVAGSCVFSACTFDSNDMDYFIGGKSAISSSVQLVRCVFDQSQFLPTNGIPMMSESCTVQASPAIPLNPNHCWPYLTFGRSNPFIVSGNSPVSEEFQETDALGIARPFHASQPFRPSDLFRASRSVSTDTYTLTPLGSEFSLSYIRMETISVSLIEVYHSVETIMSTIRDFTTQTFCDGSFSYFGMTQVNAWTILFPGAKKTEIGPPAGWQMGFRDSDRT